MRSRCSDGPRSNSTRNIWYTRGWKEKTNWKNLGRERLPGVSFPLYFCSEEEEEEEEDRSYPPSSLIGAQDEGREKSSSVSILARMYRAISWISKELSRSVDRRHGAFRFFFRPRIVRGQQEEKKRKQKEGRKTEEGRATFIVERSARFFHVFNLHRGESSEKLVEPLRDNRFTAPDTHRFCIPLRRLQRDTRISSPLFRDETRRGMMSFFSLSFLFQ